jgi:HEAT repeat protein
VTTTVFTPQRRIEACCVRHGSAAVAEACMRLVAGAEIDPLMREVFGDQHSQEWLDRDVNQYWPRVWGTRGLLWNWDDRAVPSIRAALGDEHWRVREMACKVVARHLVDAVQPEVAALVHDPVPRVRAAASRAVTALSLGA